MPPPPHARAPPALPDELIEEVLLRVPPDDPASLVRAALACRRWCRLLADPAFRRRRLELHRATPPPMLGFLCDGIWAGRHPSARFVPTSSCRPPRADLLRLRTLDARHGRVLFHSCASKGFIVWDPITDQRVELPNPPWFLRKKDSKATVLCAATGTGTGVCDHLNCHHGPFVIVLVGTTNNNNTAVLGTKNIFSCIYSSESGAWSKPTYHDDHSGHDLVKAHSALVGNTLFLALCNYDSILEYDLGSQQMSMISLPSVRTHGFPYFVPIQLTTLEDGGRRLGFARVEFSELCLWSRGEGGDDVKGWTLCKIINLDHLFPPLDCWFRHYQLVGFAESVCVAFVAVEGGLFTIDMKSGLMKKVSEGRGICCVVPYINFCNPALVAPSKDDGQTVGISSGKGGRLKRLKS